LTCEEVEQQDENGVRESSRCGTQAWGETGIGKACSQCISANNTVGRGVLLDIYSWACEKFDPFTSHAITASDLIKCAEAQGVEFRTGDILLVRTGWVKDYLKKDANSKQELANIEKPFEHYYVGLEPSEEMLDFLHDNYFAAAVADSICFEVWPPKGGSMGKISIQLLD
jgi:kynurenine formamidase